MGAFRGNFNKKFVESGRGPVVKWYYTAFALPSRESDSRQVHKHEKLSARHIVTRKHMLNLSNMLPDLLEHILHRIGLFNKVVCSGIKRHDMRIGIGRNHHDWNMLSHRLGF